MANHNGIVERYWKSILGLSGGGAALIGAMFWLHDARSQPDENVPATNAGDQYLEATDVSSVPPEPQRTIAAPPEIAFPEPIFEGPFTVVSEYGDRQHGFYKDERGDCFAAYGQSPAEMASDIEADLGRRVEGYSGFKDGMIVRFRNGSKTAIWVHEIDCKDPPYNPLRDSPQDSS